MELPDKVLACRDCGTEFVFTAGEQAFFAERGFSDPVRCPACRAARRQARTAESAGGLGNGGFNAAPRPERRFYPAVCAECGQDTMLPFEPRTGRPVYCRDCYQRLNPRY